MENDDKGLRRYSIRLPNGESTVRAEAINFALSEKGAWLTNLNGSGVNPYVPGLVEADVRDLTAGEEPWGHDENAAEGFEPETFPAVVAFVERGGNKGTSRIVKGLNPFQWLRCRGWIIQDVLGIGAPYVLAHAEIDVVLEGLTIDDVKEVAKLMGWQG